MQMKCSRKLPSFILCMVLIVAMALFTTGCNGGKKDGPSGSGAAVTGSQTDVQQIGEGSKTFAFSVVDREGGETQFEVHTDKDTVGDALLELGLIAGEEGAYGLYVKTVNGITADYDKDGVYWAFYINGEYAMTGISATNITEGDSYSLKVE